MVYQPETTYTVKGLPAGKTHSWGLFAVYNGPSGPYFGDELYPSRTSLTDNTIQYYQNISQNGRWLSNYTETAQVVLSQPLAEQMVRSVEITTNAANDVTGENWEVSTVNVKTVIGGSSSHFLTHTVGPWRFTGARIPLVINLM
jgi:hypothetical protein